MEIRTLVLIAVGGLAAVAGTLLMLVAAFRQSLVWGLAVLLLPFANLAYTIVHWAEAKRGFLVTLGGVAFVAIGVASSPAIRTAMMQAHALDLARFQLPLAGFALQPAAPAPTLDEQIQKGREKSEQLEAKFAHDGPLLVAEFNALSEQRKVLKSGDPAAVEAFNHAVADYQTHNAARKAAREEIDAQNLQVESLLAARARGPVAKHVVIYSTSSCPACKMAKSYFEKKGVNYENRDLESSPEARAEFQKLGGHGVPLILVGTERMDGFSAQRLDQLL